MVEVTLSYKSKQFCKGAPGRFVYTGKESGAGGGAQGCGKERLASESAIGCGVATPPRRLLPLRQHPRRLVSRLHHLALHFRLFPSLASISSGSWPGLSPCLGQSHPHPPFTFSTPRV